jgi:uncharacterized damage-inducible protein DinB
LFTLAREDFMRPASHVLLLALVAASVAVAAPVLAQKPASDPNLGIAALRDQWKGTVDNITAAAEELTDAEYAYRPVAGVRSFGELVGHVAGTQNMICALVLGDKAPAEDAIEKGSQGKAALLAALKASTAYCAKAYAIPAAAAGAAVELFGGKDTKVGALASNAVHDAEHYGNIVTYMRMQGKVPPSSKR